MEENNVDAVTAVLLASRSITDSEQIAMFFEDTVEFTDPFTLPDMDIAVGLYFGEALDVDIDIVLERPD